MSIRASGPTAGSGEGRRDELAVLLDILRLARAPINKTQVLYRANLSFAQLERYLSFLLARGLLEVFGGERRVYKTTEKGNALIELLEHVDGNSPRSSPVVKRIGRLEKALKVNSR